jgi:hypothetical protein
MSRLTDPQRAATRRIFVRLVQFGEGRADTRRQQTISKLFCEGDDQVAFQQTISALQQGNLVTLSASAVHSDTRVDIAHEALLTGWPDLQAWVAQHRQAELVRRHLEDKAEDWVKLGAGSGGLLDSAELPEAVKWLADPAAKELGCNVDLLRLVQASRRAIRNQQLIKAAVAALFAAMIATGGTIYIKDQRAQRAMEADRLATEVMGDLSNLANRPSADPRIHLLKALRAVSLTYVEEGSARLQPLRSLHFAVQAFASPALSFPADNIHLSFSSDGARLSAAGQALRIDSDQAAADGAMVWNYALRQKLLPQPLPGRIAALRRDGLQLATVGGDGSVSVWHASTAQKLFTIGGQHGGILAAAFSPDQTMIATGAKDGTAELWDATSGRQLRALVPAHENSITALAFSSDGNLLVTADWGGKAGVWNVSIPSQPRFLAVHKEAVAAVAFRPGYRQIASASATDPNVKLWDLDTGTSQTFAGDKEGNTSVSFSPDGAKLAAGSFDGSARVWNVPDRRALLIISHLGTVYDTAFPDNHRLVAAADETPPHRPDQKRAVIHEYLLDTPALVKQALGAIQPSPTPDECRVYLLSRNCP